MKASPTPIEINNVGGLCMVAQYTDVRCLFFPDFSFFFLIPLTFEGTRLCSEPCHSYLFIILLSLPFYLSSALLFFFLLSRSLVHPKYFVTQNSSFAKDSAFFTFYVWLNSVSTPPPKDRCVFVSVHGT